MIWDRITSNGCPFRSYMASRNRGSITTIMQKVAALELARSLSKKKSDTPMSAAAPKHTSCRLVSPNITFDFTFVRSFGTVTYANLSILLNAPRTGTLRDFLF